MSACVGMDVSHRRVSANDFSCPLFVCCLLWYHRVVFGSGGGSTMMVRGKTDSGLGGASDGTP